MPIHSEPRHRRAPSTTHMDQVLRRHFHHRPHFSLHWHSDSIFSSSIYAQRSPTLPGPFRLHGPGAEHLPSALAHRCAREAGAPPSHGSLCPIRRTFSGQGPLPVLTRRPHASLSIGHWTPEPHADGSTPPLASHMASSPCPKSAATESTMPSVSPPHRKQRGIQLRSRNSCCHSRP